MNTKKKFYLRVSAVFISVAIIALFSLIGCEYFVDPIEPPMPAPYLVVHDPVLPTTAAPITIAVSGGFFNVDATEADFIIGGSYLGSLTLPIGGADAPTLTTFTFSLDQNPTSGDTITIQAKPTAFSPAASSLSNTVIFKRP